MGNCEDSNNQQNQQVQTKELNTGNNTNILNSNPTPYYNNMMTSLRYQVPEGNPYDRHHFHQLNASQTNNHTNASQTNNYLVPQNQNIMPTNTNNPNPVVQNQNPESNVVSKENENKLKESKTNLELQKDIIDKQAVQNKQLEEKLKIMQTEENKIKLEQNQKIQKLTSELNQKNQECLKIRKNYDELLLKYNGLIPNTVGLNNIGATCYMNATLQSLSNVKELSHYFLTKYTPNDANKKLSNEYCTVVKNLWDRKNNGRAFSPDSFKNTLSQMNPLFAGIAANDSKDLINFILETLHNELNKPTGKINNYMLTPDDQKNEQRMFNLFSEEMKSNFKSPISDLFYGVLETKTNCLNCQGIKYNFQIYSYIEFPLQQVYNYCLKNYPGNNYISQGIPVVDLYRCFEFYQLPTLMTGNNQIYCNDCKRSFDAYYGTLLYFLPNYLIINLNRGKNAVFQCNVKFPELLKLHKYVINQERNTVFKLVSVISHYGPSSMGGHFIAYCRHYQDNCWYNYNDSTVTKCTNPKPYLTGMPYILFYKTLDNDE